MKISGNKRLKSICATADPAGLRWDKPVSLFPPEEAVKTCAYTSPIPVSTDKVILVYSCLFPDNNSILRITVIIHLINANSKRNKYFFTKIQREDKNTEYLFVFAGPLMLVFGLIVFKNRKDFVEKSTVISGIITEIKTSPAKNNRTAYYPVIEYYDASSSLKEKYESNAACDPSKFKIGDITELRYLDEDGKKQICMNNRAGIWGFSVMLISFGILFGIIGFVFLLG